MHGEKPQREAAGDVATSDIPPMRDLAFSMLSLLIDAAAAHMRIEMAGAAPSATAATQVTASSMREARAAIDGANALLAAMREIMELDALRAVEGMLTQLQIEFVRRAGRVS